MIKALLDKRLLKKKTKYLINKLTFAKKYNLNKNKLKNYNQIIENVNRHGIFKIENFIDTLTLENLVKEFEKIVSKKIKNERNQVHLDPDEGLKSFIFNKFFHQNEIFDLLGQNYLLSDKLDKSAGGKRIFPMEPQEFANYQWHHDGDYRCFKIFLLLSDLDESGQKMEYLKGTHKLLNSHHNKILNKEDEIISKYERVSLIGKKGDCYFFDGNGLHRGNRNNSYIRDILSITYRTYG